MIDPMVMLMTAVRSGRDPGSIFQQMATQDPRVGQARQIMAGKSPQQLRQICENMCRERGITPEEVARNLGIPGLK